MDLSSFLTFLGERTFFVSITILVLLAIRPLAKKLPRKGMYFLWVILVLRILCPVNFTGHLPPAACCQCHERPNKTGTFLWRCHEPIPPKSGAAKTVSKQAANRTIRSDTFAP